MYSKLVQLPAKLEQLSVRYFVNCVAIYRYKTIHTLDTNP